MPSSYSQRRAPRLRDPQPVGVSHDPSRDGVSLTPDTHCDAEVGHLPLDAFLGAGITSARHATPMPATLSTPQRNLAAIASMTSRPRGSSASQCAAANSPGLTMSDARAGGR